MRPLEPTVLRPRLGRRVVMLLCGVFLSVIGIGAITSGALVPGVVSAAFGLWAVVVFGARLFVPHAYETELTVEGFRVHDSFGRVVHDVSWSELKRITPVAGNAPLRPGGDTLVGFDVADPGPPRPALLRRKGVDGSLSDPYSGYESVVAQMRRYLEATTPAGPRAVRPPDLSAF
jgi:hypothetical protein